MDEDSIAFSLFGQDDGGVGLFSSVLVDDTEASISTPTVIVPKATLPTATILTKATVAVHLPIMGGSSSLFLGSPAYMGCYLDQVVTANEAAGAAPGGDTWTQSMWTERALPYVKLTKDNSIQACATIASAHGSLFFGMEAGSECW